MRDVARSRDYLDVEEEWRTTPTDLGGWANRATKMLSESRRLRAALARVTGYEGDEIDALLAEYDCVASAPERCLS